MYRRRIKIFLLIIGLVFAVIIARLGYLQIVRGEYYRSRARSLLRIGEPLQAARGQILDRHKRILAIDAPCYDICLDYRFITGNSRWMRRQIRLISRKEGLSGEQAEEVYRRRARRTWQLAGKLTGGAQDELDRRIRRIVRRVEKIRRIVEKFHGIIGMEVLEQRQFHPIVTGLDESTAVAMRSELDDAVGVMLRPSYKRRYPHGRWACHVIGVTGQVNPQEQEQLNLPEDQGDWLARLLTNYLPGDTGGL